MPACRGTRDEGRVPEQSAHTATRTLTRVPMPVHTRLHTHTHVQAGTQALLPAVSRGGSSELADGPQRGGDSPGDTGERGQGTRDTLPHCTPPPTWKRGWQPGPGRDSTVVPAQPKGTPSRGPLITHRQTGSYLHIVQHHQGPVDTTHRLVGLGEGGKDMLSASRAGDAPTALPASPPPSCGCRGGAAASAGLEPSHPSTIHSCYPTPYPSYGPGVQQLLNRRPRTPIVQEMWLLLN